MPATPRPCLTALLALALTALVLAACESSQTTGPPLRSPLQLLAVNAGQVGPSSTSAMARVFKQADDLPPDAARWLGSAQATDFTRVDWQRRDVVVVTLGQKPTAGYAVRIDRIVATDWGLEVYVTEQAPDDDAIVAQVQTHPWAAALVFKTDNTVISKLHITPAN